MKKNGKNTKPQNDAIAEIKEEFKRHTTALMEHMTKEVKIVAEGHTAIMRKLEYHDGRFGDMDKRFDKVDAKLIEHDKKFVKVESELQSISVALMETGHETKDHEKRIKKLEEKVPV